MSVKEGNSKGLENEADKEVTSDEKVTADVEMLKTQSELAANLAKLIAAGIPANDVKALMGGMMNANSGSVNVMTSKTQIPVPKIQKGMSFEDYKDLVAKWECMTDVPDRKKAMILTMELPLNDAHGGLQRAVRNKFKNEELMVNDGVEKLITFLGTILQEQTFVRLRGWMYRWENFRQKPSWSLERYLTEFHTLVSEAKTQFNHDIHPQFQALKLMNGCTDIPEDHVGTLTCSLDIKAQDFPQQIEKIIRSFVSSKKAMGARNEENVTNYCDEKYDLYGERIVSPEKNVDRGENENLFTSSKNQKMNKKMTEKRRAEAFEKGNCTACYKPGHRYRECDERKKKLEKVKEWKLSQGITWRNDDGTVTLPNGRVVSAAEAEASKVAQTSNIGITFATVSGEDFKPELLYEDTTDDTFVNYMVEMIEVLEHQSVIEEENFSVSISEGTCDCQVVE